MVQLTPAPGKFSSHGKEIISTDLLQDEAVTTAKIKGDAVTTAKMAPTYMKVATGALAAGAANAFAFAWQNPEDAKILVHKIIIDITTAGGTGSSVMDVDVVASASDTDADIFDGIDLNAIAILVSTNVNDTGTDGDEKVHKVDENGGSNDYITGKILVQDALSLAGKYYIYYTEVAA